MNPLLDFTSLPRFDDIQPEHIAPAIDSLAPKGTTLVVLTC